MLKIGDRQIKRAVIVDDDSNARDSHEFLIRDMNLTPYKVNEVRNGNLQSFFDKIQPSDAILCDFHLKKRDYAQRNGDWVMWRCFQEGIPGALCTSIHEAPIRRDYLRYIPGLLRKVDPSPDELRLAWTKCIEELAGEPQPSRRPWRTLVRVGDVDKKRKCFYAVVPAWNARVKVRIDLDNLPENIRKLVKPDHRFHALVNTGAMDSADLYFDEWEEK
ncbi:MAG: hypothetical protein OXD43_06750 [Bacteroidetes bacterium]|nr:hypothetical protein [Bacteroidota bacterium]